MSETHENKRLVSTCCMCFESFTPAELDDPNEIYREVKSWVYGKKLQSPVLREQTGRLAHSYCIEKVLDGQSPDQKPLPGLEAREDRVRPLICESCGGVPSADCDCRY